jgi:EAL domain-containing protein (putative c-di-GMP-specific phosphodiesterase class I)
MAVRLLAAGRALRNRWRQSFVLSVTMIALIGVAVFAVVIAHVASNQIEDQAIARARQTASIIARASFAPRLPAPGKQLAPADVAALDRQLGAARGPEPLLTMRLWSRDGSIVYAPDHAAIGTRPALPPVVRAALRGNSATAVQRHGTTDTSPSSSLTSAVPVRPAQGAPVAAALELRLPYAPIGKDIRTRTRRVYLALLIAALVAYALALPALIRAGRAVRAQYDPRRLALMRDLRAGMKRGELKLHFHPIADARTGKVHTAEALIRWEHPERGLVAPDRFVPLIEPTELMWPLTIHIFELVMREARDWRERGIDVRIAVNVSTTDVIDARLPAELERLLREHDVRADALEIEVTEGALMEDPSTALSVLAQITDVGIGVIAIDDFGTGYSSLARLHELPLDELKIDQSFVRRMAAEGDDTIVRSIVELAHALRFRVIAEGVESDETWSRLLDLGVDYIQGYVMTPPLPSDDFVRWLDEVAPAERLPA